MDPLIFESDFKEGFLGAFGYGERGMVPIKLIKLGLDGISRRGFPRRKLIEKIIFLKMEAMHEDGFFREERGEPGDGGIHLVQDGVGFGFELFLIIAGDPPSEAGHVSFESENFHAADRFLFGEAFLPGAEEADSEFV